jgi:aminoglycoside phosphotransferase (APT) family kinase protein
VPAQQPIAETAELTKSLRSMGVIDAHEEPRYTVLAGGVSSEIWRVDVSQGPICVKRALAKLRVEQDWFVPVQRAQYEVSWFRTVGSICPQAVPRVLGFDQVRNVFAMEFLDPGRYPTWKSKLREGQADPAFAAAVGQLLAHIHSSTADRPEVEAAFSSDLIFREIRLEPYFAATADRHPDLGCRLSSLMQSVATVRRALVHGDVSPKNILIGAAGPIFIDAECASYGDPAFDLAFCLNHMLLKSLWVPSATRSFLACFDALSQAYLAGVTWEGKTELEGRAAALLPGLLLARVDGKSPVEYITDDGDRNQVRRVARALISTTPARLITVRTAWTEALGVA